MELEFATPGDMARELAGRGLHGLIAIDDLAMDGDGSSAETRRGVSLFGHPVVSVGLADEALRRARAEVDGLGIEGGEG